MSKKYLTIINKYVRAIRNKGIKVDEVYLFGSRINGKSHKWSDLDTCIISPDFGKDPIAETSMLFSLTRDISLLIEPHPFSPQDFNDKFNPLAQEVKRTGIKVI